MARDGALRSLVSGQFRMWPAGGDPQDDPLATWCLLGATDGAPRLIRGYGGWATKQRAGRRSVSSFAGTETPAYQVTIRLAHRPSRVLMERQMRRLEQLAGLDELLDDSPSGPVRWAANVPHDYLDAPTATWLVESLEWGASFTDDGGVLRWQEATIVLAVQSDTQNVSALQRSASFPRHTLRKGQTLRDFARRWLKDPKRWRDVAELNRDNPRCPTTPEHRVGRDVVLLTPPREK